MTDNETADPVGTGRNASTSILGDPAALRYDPAVIAARRTNVLAAAELRRLPARSHLEHLRDLEAAGLVVNDVFCGTATAFADGSW